MRWLFVVLLACGGSPPPKPPPATKTENRCAYVADHLLSLLSDTAKEAPIEELDRMRTKFNRHCIDDVWSPEAQNCFLALTKREEVDVCATRLTASQRGALEHPMANPPPDAGIP